jgi:hypothetical protein
VDNAGDVDMTRPSCGGREAVLGQRSSILRECKVGDMNISRD